MASFCDSGEIARRLDPNFDAADVEGHSGSEDANNRANRFMVARANFDFISKPSKQKDASGADSPMLARHLQKLGGAYEKQGKMEAATLTLEEAGSVLEHAYGPDHPEVQALREQLAALIEPEPEEEEEEIEEEEEPAAEEATLEVSYK